MELEVVDVRTDPSRMQELLEISSQGMTPTLKHGDFVVADFDLDEFEQALKKPDIENRPSCKACFVGKGGSFSSGRPRLQARNSNHQNFEIHILVDGIFIFRTICNCR